MEAKEEFSEEQKNNMEERTKDFESTVPLEDENAAKVFLFHEFNKLREAQEALEEERLRMESVQKDMENQRKKLDSEAKGMMEKELFFEKKMQILKDGYLVMDEDRRKLEYDRAKFVSEQKKASEALHTRRSTYLEAFEMKPFETSAFFAGVNSLLALKKRYRDLLKIYHPDNYTGDSETLILIKKEYDKLCRYYECSFEAE